MGSEELRIGILGPLEISTASDAVAIGAPKQRALLALLALRPGYSATTEQLIDGLWDEDPPRSAQKTLQTYVSGLRRILPTDVIRTAGGGYELAINPENIDAYCFEALVGSARKSQAEGEVAVSIDSFRQALSLWRGPALADVLSELPGTTAASRLDELRRVAVEDLADLLLESGQHRELIADLETSVSEEPLREKRWAQLMTALYRSGRQADALRTFQRLKTLLSDELGIEPSADLVQLEQDILLQETTLDPIASETASKPLPVDLAVVQATALPPSGTLTLLMTDIEGSTRLWEEHPEEMAAALRRHDELLRNAIVENEGHVVKTVGDAFHAAFLTPRQAVAAATQAQQLLRLEEWPAPITLKVRMAIHTGQYEERDRDYFGPAVNRVARLAAIGHGGQVLVSGTTAEILEDAPEQTVGLHDLGMHHLKDLSRPERVFQLNVEGLETVFPPLRSLYSPTIGHNLPVQNTSFVGRETEIAEVISLLDRSHLVTLTGAGGSGKSRLALQVAAETLDAFGNSVWLAELAPVADPELVVATVATALGVREEPGRPLEDTVMVAISDRRLLVVLDNCEHVLDACSDLTDRLVRSCPNLGVLATSREPLGIDGEQLYRVPSLSLPEAKEPSDPVAAIAFDAVHLFVDRAKAHVSSFVLDQTQASAVVSLCRKLDGLPLAIELAAARVSSLSVADIDMRLDDRFRLLTKGRRTALPRQQTLRALIDWSYDALTSEEQGVLRRLSVFAGGWDLDACQTVCSLGSHAETDVLDVLGSLVSKSLVQAEPIIGGLRYGLLETIRQYGAEKLAEAGSDEEESTRNAHADVFLGFVEFAAAQLRGPDQVRWIDRLDREYENIRAALSHLSDQGRISAVLRMSVALKEYWIRRGYFNEGLQILDGALVRTDIEDPRIRAAAVIAAGRLGNEMRRGQWSQAMLIEGLDLSRRLDHASLMSSALTQLAYAAGDQGDYESAMQLVGEAIESASRTNDPVLLGDAYLTRSNIPWPSDRSAARQDCLDAISLFSKARDPSGLAGAESSLAMLDLREGNLETAYARFRKVLDKSRESKDDRQILTLYAYIGLTEMLHGDTSAAKGSFKDGLTLAVRMGHRPVLMNNLIGLAGCASAAAENERAAMLYGAASTLQNQVQMFDPDVENLCEWDKKRLRRRLGESEFADSYEAGSKLTTSDVIRLALE